MSIESNVHLELCWQGDYAYKEKSQVTAVEVMIDSSSDFSLHILALINKNLPSQEEQLLSFTSIHSTNSLRKKLHYYKQLDCPLHLIKELSLSIEIYPTEENDRINKKPLAEKSSIHQRHTQCSYIPLKIQQLSELEADAAYQLKILHQDGDLRAALIKKVHQTVAPRLMEEPIPSLNQTKIEKPLNTQNQKWLTLAGHLVMNEEEAREKALEIEEAPEENLCSSMYTFIC